MSQIIISPAAITANVQSNSASHTVPTNITSASVQLTDSTGATTPLATSTYRTTPGNITQWGIQRSTDGGATWQWYLYQTNIAFGSRDKAGGMPSLGVSSGDIIASAGDRVRLAIVTDTNLTLGAIVTIA